MLPLEHSCECKVPNCIPSYKNRTRVSSRAMFFFSTKVMHSVSKTSKQNLRTAKGSPNSISETHSILCMKDMINLV